MAGSLNLDAAVQAASAEDTSVTSQVQGGAAPVDQSVPNQPSTDAGSATSGQPDGAVASQQGASAQVPGTGAGAAQQSWALRNQLAKFGVDPSQFTDDQAAWGYVEQQLQVRAQEYERQQLLLQWHQQQLNQMQRQPAPQAQPQAEQKWWNPPEYDPQWEKPFGQDKDGRPISLADLDHGVKAKLASYRDWQRDQFNNLLRDPIKTLEPGLKEFVQPLVQQAIQQHLGQYQERQFANQWVQSQADQLFAKDQQGNQLRDAYGQPVLSSTGQRFVQIVQYLEKSGVTNPQAQQQIASAMLRSEQQSAPHGVPGLNGNGAQTPDQKNAAIKAAALQRATPGANRLPGSGGAPPVAATTPNGMNRGVDPRLSLGQRLNKALSEGGVTSIG